MNLKQMIEEAKQLADESPGKFLVVKKGGEFYVNMFNVLIVKSKTGLQIDGHPADFFKEDKLYAPFKMTT